MTSMRAAYQNTEINEEHIHRPQKVAPSGAAGIQVTAAVGAWALGNFSNDIIAAGTETNPFDLHWVDVVGNNNADFECVLYYGPADTECARFAFTRIGVQQQSFQLHVQTPMIPAGSRVRAKVMASAGGASITIKLFYHDYP
jgi:hypothetical protein